MSYKNDRITGIPAPLPKDYDRVYSFTDWATNNPTDPIPGNQLDAEFNAIQQAMDETQDRLLLIQRSDGALKNKSVGLLQLKEEVDIGVNTPTDWAAFTLYDKRDTVIYNNVAWYLALESHTSSNDFIADRDAGKWKLLLDFTAFFTTEAEHWANHPEDKLVPEGDQVDDYSALHWANKAAASAASASQDADDAQAAAASLNIDDPATGAVEDQLRVNSAKDGYELFTPPKDAATAGGTANALTASLDWAAYYTNRVVTLKVTAANTGATTLDLDGLGAQSVTLSDGAALPAGTLQANKIYQFRYDGTKFVVLNPSVSQPVAEAGAQSEGIMTPERTKQTSDKVRTIQSSFTVTVGTGGDHATIGAALADITKRYPVYSSSGIEVTINLLSGFVLNEEVVVSGLNLGFVNIVAEDAPVSADEDGIGTFFKFTNGATAPQINCRFSATNKVGSGKEGFHFTGCSRGVFGSTFGSPGFENVSGTGLLIEDSSSVSAQGGRFSGCDTAGVGLYDSSTGNLSQIDCNNCGTGVIVVHSHAEMIVLETNGYTTNGVLVQGGTAYIESGDLRQTDGGAEASSDLNITKGGIATLHGGSGGSNLTANSLSSDGILFK